MNLFRSIASRLPRMWDWVLLTVILFIMVWWIAPQQLPVVLYKTLLVSLAAVVTYWVDRSLFVRLSDRIKPGMRRDMLSAARVLARALIFVGCVLGMTLGL